MKKIIIIIITLLALGTAFYFSTTKTPVTNITGQKNTTADVVTPASAYYYPMTQFNQRIKIRSFGTVVKTGDEKKLVCGNIFNGIHTGVDLEILSGEQDKEVPVFSIADGKIVQSSWVSGYGGLVVIDYFLNGASFTAYYGHLNINTVKYKTGDQVKAGAVVGYLGKACSQETDYERKHLHFALHKGSKVDLRGYVNIKPELANWVDPAQELATLKAR